MISSLAFPAPGGLFYPSRRDPGKKVSDRITPAYSEEAPMTMSRRSFLAAHAAAAGALVSPLLAFDAAAGDFVTVPAKGSVTKGARGRKNRRGPGDPDRRRQVQGLGQESRVGPDPGSHAPRRPRRHARIFRVLRGLSSAGRDHVLVLRPARL